MCWRKFSFLRLIYLMFRLGPKEVIRRIEADCLTGLARKEKAVEELRKEIKRAQRYDRPLCLAFMDLDNFGRINKEYGHSEGDRTLAEFGRVVSEEIRGTDYPARFGGDEFLLIFPETKYEDAIKVIDRIIFEARKMKFPIDFSFGLSSYRKGDTVESMKERADFEMRKKKKEKL